MKMTYKFRLLLILMSGWCLVACSDDEMPDIVIDNPAEYDFVRDGSSTVSFSGQSTRIAMATELINAMKDFNASSQLMLEMYANETSSGGDADPYSDPALNASTKSVKSKVAASSDFFSSNTAESAIIKAEIESWIISQVSEVFPRKDNLAEKGLAGQIADGSSVRYVNADGLEYNQAVNKSLIGALMLDQMCNNYLSTSVLDAGENRVDNDAGTLVDGKAYTNMEHKWDEAYGYLFGAASNTKNPIPQLGEDSFLNKYLKRVNDDTDFAGIADDIFEAFKLGRAAIVAKDYNVRDQQAEILREKLSTIVAVRAIFYLQNGKIALENDDFGGAFHDLSEGFGFVYSLRFARKANSADPYFTKAEVDTMIGQLTAGDGFWDLTSTTLDQLSETIASKFNFTVAQAGS